LTKPVLVANATLLLSMEVSPALKLLFPAEEIERLTAAYEAASKQEGVALEGGAGEDDMEDDA
jgi:hypothetical protein